MDELELIRRVAPMADAPSPGRRDEARAALRVAAEATPRRRLRWSFPVPRRGLVLAVAVVALAIGMARGPLFLVLPSDPAATAALEDAAEVAAEAPPPLEIGHGFVYTKTDALWAFSSMDWTYWRHLVREFWIAADGSGRIREHLVEDPIFLSESERQAWLDGGFEVFNVNEDLGPGDLHSAWGDIPEDVEGVREFLRGLAESSDRRPIEVGMFVYIGDLLRDPLTTPATRASLFRVAATLPGIKLLGPMQDEVGRTGLAVAMPEIRQTEILVFDPASSALLEEKTIHHLPYGDRLPPIVWSRATYLETAIVPELPAE